jgi:hypothetical protein
LEDTNTFWEQAVHPTPMVFSFNFMKWSNNATEGLISPKSTTLADQRQPSTAKKMQSNVKVGEGDGVIGQKHSLVEEMARSTRMYKYDAIRREADCLEALR